MADPTQTAATGASAQGTPAAQPPQSSQATQTDTGRNGAQPGQAPQQSGKFYNGKFKDIADFEKSYGELERKLGEQSQRVSLADRYSAYGTPEQVQELARWAQQIAPVVQAIQSGQVKLTPAQAQQATQQAANQAWYEGIEWETLTPREQIARIDQELRKSLTGDFTQLADRYWGEGRNQIAQIAQALQQQQALQLQVALDAMERKINNPNLNLRDLITTAIQLAQQGQQQPTSWLEQAMSRMTEGDRFNQRVTEEVQARLLKERQERENNMNPLGPTSQSIIARRAEGPKTIQEARALAIEKLREKGINI